MYDLGREGDRITLGPGSKKACNRAITTAREIGLSAVILLSATVPPNPTWKGITMGKVAQEYIARAAPDVITAFHEARWFNTIGEIWALVEYLKLHSPARPVANVIIAVKWWHAPRTAMITHLLFTQVGIETRWSIRTHWLGLGRQWWRTLAHEIGGFVRNRAFIRAHIRGGIAS